MTTLHSEKLTLLTNASATGSGVFATMGGRYVFRIDGTFSGATCTLQMLSPDGSSWLTLQAFTAEGTATVEVPQGGTYRVLVASGPPSAMYADMVRVPL